MLDALRERIISGKWRPGDRVTPHLELAEEFGVSTFTVQQALDQLTQDGFTEVHSRRGTYVAPHLPHLCRYALLFHYAHEHKLHWTRFWTALNNEAMRLRRPPELEFLMFYGIDGHTDTEDYLRLEREIQAHRLAGLIFTSDPAGLEHAALFQEPTLPCVAIEAAPSQLWTPVNLDLLDFIDRALDRLVALGRRRIAVVTPHIPESKYGRHIAHAVAARGMEMPAYLFQTVDATTPQAARNCVHLLLHDPQHRPDALIVTDDNLVEYASAGLVAAGVRTPQEVAVIAHCNFPWPTPSVVDVQRLGYDARAVLQTCMEQIDQRRRGLPPPLVSPLRPIFEEEIS